MVPGWLENKDLNGEVYPKNSKDINAMNEKIHETLGNEEGNCTEYIHLCPGNLTEYLIQFNSAGYKRDAKALESQN